MCAAHLTPHHAVLGPVLEGLRLQDRSNSARERGQPGGLVSFFHRLLSEGQKHNTSGARRRKRQRAPWSSEYLARGAAAIHRPVRGTQRRRSKEGRERTQRTEKLAAGTRFCGERETPRAGGFRPQQPPGFVDFGLTASPPAATTQHSPIAEKTKIEPGGSLLLYRTEFSLPAEIRKHCKSTT